MDFQPEPENVVAVIVGVENYEIKNRAGTFRRQGESTARQLCACRAYERCPTHRY
jgi:hypothetical protein